MHRPGRACHLLQRPGDTSELQGMRPLQVESRKYYIKVQTQLLNEGMDMWGYLFEFDMGAYEGTLWELS